MTSLINGTYIERRHSRVLGGKSDHKILMEIKHNMKFVVNIFYCGQKIRQAKQLNK